MKKYLAASLISGLMILTLSAHAEVVPQSYPTDEHVQVAIYNPNQVYRVNAMQGYITSIQFGQDEKILSVNIGDSSSWLVSVQNDVVNLKPTASHPDTNLNVLTSRGTYQFLLTAPALSTDGNGELARKARENTAFLLRFRYPEQSNTLGSANLKPPEPTVKNWRYSARGNPLAAPLFVFDDGNFTYFYFGAHKDIPAIFTVDAGGNESVVNYHLQSRYIVVETTSKQFTLRNGTAVASVFNDDP